jgi:hypothetical protein
MAWLVAAARKVKMLYGEKDPGVVLFCYYTSGFSLLDFVFRFGLNWGGCEHACANYEAFIGS